MQEGILPQATQWKCLAMVSAIRRAGTDVRDEWQPGMAIVDFTNPEACKWYVGLIHTLMDTGVDTIKTDFGERIPHLDVVYHDGSDPRQVSLMYCLTFR